MALQLGKVGTWGITTMGTDIDLPDPTEISVSGNMVSISGVARGSTVADGMTLREQLQNLHPSINLDEQAVPVIFGGANADLDGYYYVRDISVEGPPGSGARRIHSWSAQLERVYNSRSAVVESTIIGFVPTNTHAISGIGVGRPYAVHAVPSTYLDYSTFWSDTAADTHTIEGDYILSCFRGRPTAYPATTSVRYTIPVADYYKGSPMLTIGHTSADRRRVIGRQMLNRTGTAWMLSNGLVEVTQSATPGNLLSCRWWNGAATGAWESTYQFFLRSGVLGNSAATPVVAASVVRNGPEETIIRLSTQYASFTFNGLLYVDVSLRRGSKWVTVIAYYAVVGVSTPTFGIQASAAVAMTDGVGYIRATANDASGNRLIMAATSESAQDLVNARLTGPVTSTALFGIGMEIDGTLALTKNTAAVQAEDFYARINESINVVGR